VLAKLENAVHSGHFDEEFRIVRPDGEVRCVGEGFAGTRCEQCNPGNSMDGAGHHGEKTSDAQVPNTSLRPKRRARKPRALVRRPKPCAGNARAHADLRMDAVLDTLLQTLFQIVTYDSGRVILTEENERLFVARGSRLPRQRTGQWSRSRRRQRHSAARPGSEKAMYVPDTREECDWRDHKGLPVFGQDCHSLVVSDSVLVCSRIGSKQPRAFTTTALHSRNCWAFQRRSRSTTRGFMNGRKSTQSSGRLC